MAEPVKSGTKTVARLVSGWRGEGRGRGRGRGPLARFKSLRLFFNSLQNWWFANTV